MFAGEAAGSFTAREIAPVAALPGVGQRRACPVYASIVASESDRPI